MKSVYIEWMLHMTRMPHQSVRSNDQRGEAAHDIATQSSNRDETN